MGSQGDCVQSLSLGTSKTTMTVYFKIAPPTTTRKKPHGKSMSLSNFLTFENYWGLDTYLSNECENYDVCAVDFWKIDGVKLFTLFTLFTMPKKEQSLLSF
jgi:hypothetical protein